jgi:hypothetical protein
MSVQETNEQNYWKAYCQIIKSAAQPAIGPNSALFFCTETVRGIPAADWIPQEVTNLSLFFMADSLYALHTYMPPRLIKSVGWTPPTCFTSQIGRIVLSSLSKRAWQTYI